MVITASNRYNFVELGVDSGQMAVAPRPPELNSNFDENDSYVAVIKARPNAKVYVRIDMFECDRDRTARLIISTTRMTGSDAHFNAGEDGVLVVADPCYFLTGDVAYDAGGDVTTTNDYSQACQATCNSTGEIFGTFKFSGGVGFCTSSGYGDGSYQASITLDAEGFAETVEVTFIDDEDDEDDDSWDDEDDSEDDSEDDFEEETSDSPADEF